MFCEHNNRSNEHNNRSNVHNNRSTSISISKHSKYFVSAEINTLYTAIRNIPFILSSQLWPLANNNTIKDGDMSRLNKVDQCWTFSHFRIFQNLPLDYGRRTKLNPNWPTQVLQEDRWEKFKTIYTICRLLYNIANFFMPRYNLSGIWKLENESSIAVLMWWINPASGEFIHDHRPTHC